MPKTYVMKSGQAASNGKIEAAGLKPLACIIHEEPRKTRKFTEVEE